MKSFKIWLNENSNRTGAKLGLYPSIEDALGQYPPLYAMPSAADLITYFDIMYGAQNPLGSNGIIRFPEDSEHAVKNKNAKFKYFK